MSRYLKYFAVFALVAMVVPVAGCLFGARSESTARTVSDNNVLINVKGITGSGLAPSADGAPQRTIENLGKRHITIYRNVGAGSTATTLKPEDFVWNPDNDSIRIPRAGNATYTVCLARVARFSVLARAGWETVAEADVPGTIEWKYESDDQSPGSADANAYVSVRVKALDYQRRRTATDDGFIPMAYYQYVNESQVGENGLFSATFNPARLNFYQSSEVPTIGENDDSRGNDLDISTITDANKNVRADLEEKLDDDDFAEVTTLAQFEEQFDQAENNLMWQNRTTIFRLARAGTGATTTINNADDMLASVEASSKVDFSISRIVMVSASNWADSDINVQDEALDYGDDIYFVIVTHNHDDDDSELQVSAAIHSHAGDEVRPVAFGSKYVIDVPVIDGEENVWGSSALKTRMTTQNVKNGRMEVTFTVTDRGVTRIFSRYFSAASGTVTPDRPSFSMVVTDANPGTTTPAAGDTAEVEFPYPADNTKPIYLNIINSNVEQADGMLYLRVRNSIFQGVGQGKNILPATAPTGWTKISVPGDDYYGYFKVPLSRFGSISTSWQSQVNSVNNTGQWGVSFRKSNASTYVIRLTPPSNSSAKRKYGTFHFSAYLEDTSTSAISRQLTEELVFSNKGWDDDNDSVSPNFDLGWAFLDPSKALTDETMFSQVSEITLGADKEGYNFNIFMKPTDDYVVATAGKVDTTHLIYHIFLMKDGDIILNDFYRAPESQVTNVDARGEMFGGTLTGDMSFRFNGQAPRWHVLDTGFQANEAGNYTLRVRSVAPDGSYYDGVAEQLIEIEVVDFEAPQLTVMDDAVFDIVLSFNVDLDLGGTLTPDQRAQFTIAIDDSDEVTITGATYAEGDETREITLTVSSDTPVTAASTVTLSYEADGDHAIKTVGGRKMADIDEEEVNISDVNELAVVEDAGDFETAVNEKRAIIRLDGNITNGFSAPVDIDYPMTIELDENTLTYNENITIDAAVIIEDGSLTASGADLLFTDKVSLGDIVITSVNLVKASSEITLIDNLEIGANTAFVFDGDDAKLVGGGYTIDGDGEIKFDEEDMEVSNVTLDCATSEVADDATFRDVEIAEDHILIIASDTELTVAGSSYIDKDALIVYGDADSEIKNGNNFDLIVASEASNLNFHTDDTGGTLEVRFAKALNSGDVIRITRGGDGKFDGFTDAEWQVFVNGTDLEIAGADIVTFDGNNGIDITLNAAIAAGARVEIFKTDDGIDTAITEHIALVVRRGTQQVTPVIVTPVP